MSRHFSRIPHTTGTIVTLAANPDALLRALTVGQAAMETSQWAEAIGAFAEAQALAPTDLHIALALANAHRLGGDALGARRTLLAAARQRPSTDAAREYELGAALLDAGAPREAAACFTRVVRLTPGDPAPLGALAGAKRSIGEPEAAWAFIQQALALAPAHPAFLFTAAQIRHDLGDLEGARHWIGRADAVRPNHAATQVQRAYTSLLAGSSHKGWTHFEARPLPVPDTRATPWHGQSLEGASLLVTAEQGVGDQFQFARFIAALEAYRPGRVVVECHADAVSLFAASGFDAVARGQAPTVETDWHVPMMSLPYHLHTDGAVLGDRVPYLRAPRDQPAMLPPGRREGVRRLGLVWAGNPAFSGRVTRDLDAAYLADIAAIPDVEWIALQHGPSGDDVDRVPEGAITRVPLSTSWAVTAAMLGELDGLVTTDTGIAHLAGALGIRTWVILQHVPDWRWGLHGTTSPWYPSLQLLRQPRPRDWGSVVEALRDSLRDALHDAPGGLS